MTRRDEGRRRGVSVGARGTRGRRVERDEGTERGNERGVSVLPGGKRDVRGF